MEQKTITEQPQVKKQNDVFYFHSKGDSTMLSKKAFRRVMAKINHEFSINLSENDKTNISIEIGKCLKNYPVRGNRITVCGILKETPAGNNESIKSIRIGVSLCSEKDNFAKKNGRLLAYQRAVEQPQDILEDVNTQIKVQGSPEKVFVSYCKEICIEEYLKRDTLKVTCAKSKQKETILSTPANISRWRKFWNSIWD